MRRRFNGICLELDRNRASARDGLNVTQVIESLSDLYKAILTMYRRSYPSYSDHCLPLATLLVDVLVWIVQRDLNAFAEANQSRPQYAGNDESSNNPYRRWISPAGHPHEFMDVLRGISAEHLRANGANLRWLYNTIHTRWSHEPPNPSSASTANVINRLYGEILTSTCSGVHSIPCHSIS